MKPKRGQRAKTNKNKKHSAWEKVTLNEYIKLYKKAGVKEGWL